MALNYQELSDFQLASLIRTGTSNALCGASHELGRRAERDAIQKYLPGLLCDYLSHLDGRRLEVVHAGMTAFWELVRQDLKSRRHIP